MLVLLVAGIAIDDIHTSWLAVDNMDTVDSMGGKLSCAMVDVHSW